MILDILIAAVFIYGAWVGYRKDILGILFIVLRYSFALLGAMWFTPLIDDILYNTFKLKYKYTTYGAFVLTIGLSFLVMNLISMAVDKGFNEERSKRFDNYGGAILLAVFYLFVLSILLRFADRAALVSEKQRTESKAYHYVTSFPTYGEHVVKKTFPVVKDFVRYMSLPPDSAHQRYPVAPIQRKFVVTDSSEHSKDNIAPIDGSNTK